MFALTDVDMFKSVNLKCDPEEAVLHRERYPAVVPGYHMNKKHWNTVVCDDNAPSKEIKKWINDSYDLVFKGLPKRFK
jgi:predicted DNA-binding protein (MmcQ/YjbR family)